MSQHPFLPIPTGQFGFLEQPNDDRGYVQEHPHSEEVSEDPVATATPLLPIPMSHQQKRHAQAARWENDVILSLIAPYMKYLKDSANLAQEPQLEALECVSDSTCDGRLSPTKAQCPLCFGGESSFKEGFSMIVEMDACFTQKHNKQSTVDPLIKHPSSVFILPEKVAIWQEFVETVWPTTKGRHRKDKPEAPPEDNCYEGPLKVLNSTLDACEDSFTAADGDRQKASMQFFDSTALMGLLCCHDQVLFLVNMTTPGEHQHYAFSLIEELFKHLPSSYTHYTRLLTLNSQIQHDDHYSLAGFGTWLARKWKAAKGKWEKGNEDVFSMCTLQFLHEQWELQGIYLGQSQSSGKKEIEKALQLHKAQDTLQDSVRRLEDIVTDLSAEQYEVLEAQAELQVLVGERTVKEHLRQKLRARKFERDRLECSFHRQLNTSKWKLHNHTEQTVKHCNLGIQSLAQKYNRLCAKMEELIKTRPTPANAVAPKPILTKELFSLDIDDLIWDDFGLGDGDDEGNPPLWASDEQVWAGIRSILLRDRCDEELLRLKHERGVLHEWFSEEWTVIIHVITNTQDLHKALSAIPELEMMESWGPTEDELEAMQSELYLDKVEDNEEEDGEHEEPDEDELDIGLLEYIDAVDVAESLEEGNV
ncbi:hypothetical protein GYMLUDRAFT_248296 [Collybiopsis luxurians FD-317 M1]|uniref:CxC1-like cysteine cluster associated with KDZ transposases domain-containing protein n=1 Tax=Collybiopsis luxurians FD-317 M1 TaxID=944289 RepID=A0A0D0CCX0_9AGAR|nr:hypothetical protein GYMLUDRAFT_248296 [Collybiopsis luxurians FD-317 M1]